MNRNFYARFWLSISLDEWKKRFINRVNDKIFNNIKVSPYSYSSKSYTYDHIFEFLCLKLWKQKWDFRYNNYMLWIEYWSIIELTQSNFEGVLHVLEILWLICDKIDFNNKVKEIIKYSIEDDWIDLWIRYHNWLFYLSWDKDLDEKIIEISLDNISWFKAKNDYEKSLKKYISWDMNWTLVSCFTTLETLSQEILGNTKWLKANKEEILKYFWWTESFSKQWNWILNWLYDYFNDYSERHNWNKRHNINDLEVEATLYQTGIIINLLIKKYNTK